MDMRSQVFLDDGENAGADTALPTRGDIGEAYKWRLEDIYQTNVAWEEDAKNVAALAEKLTAMAGTLGQSSASLYAALKLEDELSALTSKLYSYARMRRDEDNTNATYQALTDRATTLLVQADGAKAFLVPEVLALPEELLTNFLAENEELRLYKFLIDELLRQKAHVLSAPEEQLLAAVGEIAQAPGQIFTMFNNADMKFPRVKSDDGTEVELTHGRYIHFMESKQRDVRKGAFDAMYATFSKHRNTLASIHAASVKKDVFYATVRKYESARAASLDEDNVPLSVYDNLIGAVHEYLPALHKYLALRRKVLGLDELHMYDLYTPIVSDVDMKFPYDEAVKMVREAIAPLGTTYGEIAGDAFKQGWVDVYETQGKTSGAYSWGTYGVHPYILLNHQDTLDNMYTLAHELGHAMHTYFSNESQPHVYAGYTIFVAEVASTCNEALMTEHLLKTMTDKRMRAYIINHHLETIRGTLYRQTMFAEFEKLTHAHVEAGGALTPEWLSETYYELNQKYYGAEVVIDQAIEMEWSRIPHFYTPFYVYKYATGIAAATALSQKILNEGEPAVHAYINFLRSGGSDYPIELLRKAGVDMESPEPVRAALQLFDRLVDELTELLSE